ncbi:adenylate/guanylate cyclase domain-containing protein [Actinomadura sp. DC4]|uniref:adenylate/guanylate cyclase domain-containing protein n=1 Tax=Actinomadura sp. DC4 TaxID=3055069 RepID=UPI0025B07ABD|nr:adenylate/guanylate cyclase domain-containing protein [Actinomadura sp. DC4]MDN3357979.1 adenylate/guanylate cyclase domain-containing protein [Actinomadura sp. DC4]
MAGSTRAGGFRAWLDGPAGASRAVLERRTRWLLIFAVGGANLSGALFVMLFSTFVMPDPPGLGDPERIRLINLVVFSSYVVFGAPFGVVWGMRLFRPLRRFAGHQREPSEAERRAVLRGPLRLMTMQATLWGFGAVGWAAIDLAFSPLLALKVSMITLLGAITTCAIVYLLTERLLRPIAAVVMAERAAEHDGWFGITPRTMLAWALGTAVPLLGLVITALSALVVTGMALTQLAVTILVLGGLALLVGFQITYIAARAVADPVRAVREGLARIERGDLQASVPVYDASELGGLQAGFNHMAAGLRENERVRDLFGRHVGEDVARHALEHGVALGGGEVCDAAVIFADLQGSTRLAATRPPGEVVALLNAYFGIVVEVVSAHGGLINKFQGDAALAIFGAPQPLEDPAGQALAAARTLSHRLQADLPQLIAGIGVSSGQVVAGHIGAEQRLEYTVIGDPVNEAARLSDIAKSTNERLLASATVVAAAKPAEAARWRLGNTVTLRGRPARTRLATPFGVPPPRRIQRVLRIINHRR